MAASDFFSVSLDAAGTYSASFPTSQLTYLWTDLFGGVGTFPTYTFTVNLAQLNGAKSTIVTLNVADPSGRNKTVRILVPFT